MRTFLLPLLLLLASLSPLAQAERLRIVSDEWAPYFYQEDGEFRGVDYDVVSEVFTRLGVQVDWELMPWKRCLAMVHDGQVDGVLDIFKMPGRDGYLIYPNEPLSQVEFVLYQANARPHRIEHIDDLAGLTVGTSPGYTYGGAFSDSPLFRREPAPTQQANFGKLALGRIDLLLTDRRVGRFLRRQMALEQRVEELPLVINQQPQFLALARKPGREALAAAFSEELQRFRREPAYAAIQARYDPGPHFPVTVEQQESSTH